MRNETLFAALLVLSGCALVHYESPHLAERVPKHETIAVLPFEMILTGSVPGSAGPLQLAPIEEEIGPDRLLRRPAGDIIFGITRKLSKRFPYRLPMSPSGGLQPPIRPPPPGVGRLPPDRVLSTWPAPASLTRAMPLADRSARAAWALCWLWAAGTGGIEAQALTSLEFSFSNPGARSLGFGGAFVALADDATAAFANPAGLVQIAETELSVEARSWRYSTPYTSGGRAAGEPTGWGIDTVAGPLRGQSTASLSGLSYLSLVYPAGRWSLAVFRHQLANFEFGLETQGVFGPGPGVSGNVRSPIQRSFVDLEILTLGLAAGFRIGERLSLGLAGSHLDPSIEILGWDYRPDDDTVAAYFSAASFLPERLVQSLTLQSNADGWGLTAGFLCRVAQRWSLGGLYRQGRDFGFEMSLVAGPAHPGYPLGARILDRVDVTYSTPDTYALGLAYRSQDGRWTGAVEWRRVEYSTILESLLPEQRDPGDVLDDADEIHLGGEYAFFAGSSVLAVRFGAWHDPDHQIRSDADPEEEPFIRAITPAGKDELHYTMGFGVAFGRFQLDLGVDLSRRIDTASLSAIYGF